MKATAITFPPVPEYFDAAVTFVCRRNGAMLLAMDGDEPWLFRVRCDRWCAVRLATPDDIRLIQAAPRFSEVGEA